MKPTAQNTIQQLLNPEFKCYINTDVRDSKVLYSSFIHCTTKNITHSLEGGINSCLLCVGERLYQLDMECSSILVFNEERKITCNENFTVHRIDHKSEDAIKKFHPDYVFRFLYLKDSKTFFYSVPKKGSKYTADGIGTIVDDIPLAIQNKFEIYKCCTKIMKNHHLFKPDIKEHKIDYRIHEVDFKNKQWNIHTY
ncbi:hypothetical protein [Aquimarina sp. RZ0]|uniref:hypothetical protein n=1 Tax=Aquimarina sp. RZ0 TaxID=2607730 RepID=UPI0011F2D8B1|nr:hypothetical protein [Aquimarina sp. RZ0]KAA1244511.1 hypothetical protein F0000_16115 [Aquimarina sp. RZ0]